MGYLGQDIPKLGFGFMRLPQNEIDGESVIDIEQLKEMVDTYLAAGFTYFDTAWGYHGGLSEGALKAALIDRYPRESYQIATKLPAWEAKTAEEARAMLATSLERTQAGYFDFYLLHNLGDGRTKLFDDYGLWEFAAEQKANGLIRHLGFSIHDKADALESVLRAHPEVDFVQLQINYADWESPSVQSRKCYEVARAHGKPVVIMEPIKGGSLVRLPKSVKQVFEAADPMQPLASWALRYAASLEGVITVLSGMSTSQQVAQNVAIMRDFKPLDASERATVAAAQVALEALPAVPCTDCGYCTKSCPQSIKIPTIMTSLNILSLYDDGYRARENYVWNASGGKASLCIQCGVCEGICPQHIKIIDELKR
ncbi:MAG: aldo/keto reductase, partial [Raoultibacter sp.]